MTLKCDLDSYRTLEFYVGSPTTQSGWDCSRLQSIELRMDTFPGDLDHRMLCQATSLRHFHLESTSVSSQPIAVLNIMAVLKPPAPPPAHSRHGRHHNTAILKALTPSLTRLKLSLHHDAYESLITDPLMSTTVDGFPRFEALQTFEVNIHLDSRCRRLNWRTAVRSAGTGHDTWSKLDEALSKIEPLKEVRVHFHIEFVEKGWLVVTREAAEGVSAHIVDNVYPSQFQCLRSRSDRGDVDFAFAVNVAAL